MSIDNDKYYSSTNFYLSCYLITKGMMLVNITLSADSKRCNFIFRDTTLREQLVQDFSFAQPNSHEAMVDARAFISAIKTLKERMYQQC